MEKGSKNLSLCTNKGFLFISFGRTKEMNQRKGRWKW